jgi:hypothetical protein
MRSVSILRRLISRLHLASPPSRIIELGAGDGTLLLRLARALSPRWPRVELTLLDRHDCVTAETRESYRRLDWSVTVTSADVLDWARAPTVNRYDLCVTTLFLHHFEAANLNMLLTAAALRTDAFVGCEPRRDAISRLGGLSVGLIGASYVTREDAVKSVAAGFCGRELSAIWADTDGDWIVDEFRALPFTHCFTAVRAHARRAARDS